MRVGGAAVEGAGVGDHVSTRRLAVSSRVQLNISDTFSHHSTNDDRNDEPDQVDIDDAVEDGVVDCIVHVTILSNYSKTTTSSA